MYLKYLSTDSTAVWALGVVAIALAVVVVWKLFQVDIPEIKGIATIPGQKPVIGHLHLLGGRQGFHDATIWGQWSREYNAPIFQLRFGNRRVVVANSYDAVRKLSSGSAGAALSTRPWVPVFNETFGIDIGNQPMCERLRRMRTAASKSVGRPMFSSLAPTLIKESMLMERSLLREGRMGGVSLDPYRFMQVVTMNMSFALTYGARFEKEDPFYIGYVNQTNAVSKIRNSTACWANYVPGLIWLPSVRKMMREARAAHATRVGYQEQLLQELLQAMARGKAPSCIGASLIEDREAKLSKAELDSTCRSMLQGGSETISATLSAGLGSLSVGNGIDIQEKAYREIVQVYGSAEAAAADPFPMEEKVPYLTAVYKEMLRYYAVAPFAAPHEAVRDVAYENTVIPKGTIVYFNVECANHDPGFYGQDVHVFRPERWLEDPLVQKPSTGHFSYGIGARVCPALNISNHVLHGLLMRLVLDFKIVADETALPNTDPIHYGNGMDSVNKAPSPFRVFFIPRDRAALAARLGVEASEMLD